MKISYAVTVKDELEYIQNLIPFLLKHKREEDEIVVLWDNKGDIKVWEYLTSQEPNNYFVYEGNFTNNFADWKNLLNSLTSGDYLFQIDADELPSEFSIKMLPLLLEQNPETEIFFVPRINIVEGITKEYIDQMHWSVNEKGYINWESDYQGRIFKNKDEIKWEGCVHEKITGYKSYTYLPLLEEWALLHKKSFERQQKQNQLYSQL